MNNFCEVMMKIQVRYVSLEPNQDYVRKAEERDAFFDAHPRLSFEPRTLEEHTAHNTYHRLCAECDELDTGPTQTEKVGTLVFPAGEEHLWVLVDGQLQRISVHTIFKAEEVPDGQALHSPNPDRSVQAGDDLKKV
jgi:hypothetical protein